MMELQDTVNIITGILDENEKYKQEVQHTLRKYVTDKSFPLEARFEVWEKYCTKVDHGWVIHEKTVPVLGKMVDDCEPFEYERYQNYDWDHFLTWYEDDEELQEKYGLSVDEFKENLIETNFGSFDNDW